MQVADAETVVAVLCLLSVATNQCTSACSDTLRDTIGYSSSSSSNITAAAVRVPGSIRLVYTCASDTEHCSIHHQLLQCRICKHHYCKCRPFAKIRHCILTTTDAELYAQNSMLMTAAITPRCLRTTAAAAAAAVQSGSLSLAT
jgi:hypothetical protein